MIKKSKPCLEYWNQGLLEPLRRTLHYAQQNIPYYASKIRRIKGDSIHELLRCVPLLDKETAIDHLQSLRKDNIKQPGRISTGTLRKKRRFMDVQYTKAESDAIRCFFTHAQSWHHAYQSDFLKLEMHTAPITDTVVLRILNTHYEIPHLEPESNCISILWTTHANSLEIITHSLITSDIINILEIESTTLIKLTLMLIEKRVDFNQFNVESIVVFGFISNKWKSFISHYWSCPLSEVFSLSEMRAKAYLCTNTQPPHFHFTPLPIITEVIHPLTQRPLDSGAGCLVLTPLYPFTQQQLLLRYMTQDIVKIVPCDESATLGFSWCGRDKDVVFLDQENLPHSSFGLREVLECLDHYYEVARSSDDFEILGLIESGSVGWPLCKIECHRENAITRLDLHIILVYPPHLFQERTAHLCEKIKADLIHANDYLQQATHQGRLQIQIIPHPPSKKEASREWHHHEFYSTVKNKHKSA